MADIVPTQAVVISGQIKTITLGEDITILGSLLRYDNTLNSYMLAFSGGTSAESVVSYLALETGLADAQITVLQPGGIVDLGTVLLAGINYSLSATAGAIRGAGRIAPSSELISTNLSSFVGIPRTTSELLFNVLNSRVAIV